MKRRSRGCTDSGRSAWVLAGVALASVALADAVQARERGQHTALLSIERQGSFVVGGTVVTNPGTFDALALTPDGQTVRGDHAYVTYQVPLGARRLPLVMWHGRGQSAKTWETTPDGREGFQTLFLRRGFATYTVDQPRQGRAGRSTEPATLTPVPGPGNTGEQASFLRFRLGMWPTFFPGVQFSSDPAALDQWWRQQTPETGPVNTDVIARSGAALFARIGPATLLSHSAGGLPGWMIALASANVRAVVAYEPAGFVFPDAELPTPIPTSNGDVTGTPVPLADFEKLTHIPIQILYGDNIPAAPSPYAGLDVWRGRLALARLFVAALNQHGGDAELVHLPDLGITGNTHFPMSDLNNVQIADLLSEYLHQNRLDRR